MFASASCRNSNVPDVAGPHCTLSSTHRLLQFADRRIDLLVEGDAVKLVEHGLVVSVDDAVIRYAIRGAFLARLCFSKNSIMVSISGTRGATMVRAGGQ